MGRRPPVADVTQPTFDMQFPDPVHPRRREGERKPVEALEKRGPTYRRTHSATAKCDECVAEMMEGGKMRAPNPVAYARSIGGTTMLLCFLHTQSWRQADGMAEIKPHR